MKRTAISVKDRAGIGPALKLIEDTVCAGMKELAGMTARGVELNGNTFFDDFNFDGCRITWIQSNGEVLFDNEANADHMENHLEREEVREATLTG